MGLSIPVEMLPHSRRAEFLWCSSGIPPSSHSDTLTITSLQGVTRPREPPSYSPVVVFVGTTLLLWDVKCPGPDRTVSAR